MAMVRALRAAVNSWRTQDYGCQEDVRQDGHDDQPVDHVGLWHEVGHRIANPRPADDQGVGDCCKDQEAVEAPMVVS